MAADIEEGILAIGTSDGDIEICKLAGPTITEREIDCVALDNWKAHTVGVTWYYFAIKLAFHTFR